MYTDPCICRLLTTGSPPKPDSNIYITLDVVSLIAQVDQFQYHYSAHEKPNIQNDLVTLNHKMAGDPLIKVGPTLCIYVSYCIEYPPKDTQRCV